MVFLLLLITIIFPISTRFISTNQVIAQSNCPLKSQGDANCDGAITLADFEVWRREFLVELNTTNANFNNDSRVTISDFEIWRRSYTAAIPQTSPTATPVISNTPPVTSPPSTGSKLRAFPQAEGFGAETVAGRGGRVPEVPDPNDSGAGSLRACTDVSGPRICVFRIAGTITLNSDIDIINPYLTIAGQTAPGGGISLKAANPSSTVHMQIRAPEVIVRYIRSRPGTTVTNSRALSVNNGASSMDAAVKNVVIDHNSFSWTGDEMTITWLATNHISYQWNIAAESLSPWKGPSFGEGGGGYFSVHHNLIAHHTQRLPQVSASVGLVDIVNNLVYNPGGQASVVKNSTHANFINNYIKAGPNSTLKAYIEDGGAKGPAAGYYVEGNQIVGISKLNTAVNQVSTRYPAPPVTTTSAQAVYAQILNTAGAYRGLNCNGSWIERRDAVDTRIIQSVRDGTRGHSGTGYITSPSQVGGWPALASGTPCPDTDHDGMADQWETLNFGNTSRGSSSDSKSDYDSDGYTDLEEFLNGTDPKVRS